MNKATISAEKLILPTYPEPPREELPIFCENRVHQRSSGRVYPNKVNLSVNHKQKTDQEYTAVYLENPYIKVCVLPELGGKIYSAQDKTTGYHFFYKQHVIKPALVGALGSWTSGGVEFNWPYHHRPSGYMASNYTLEEGADGSVTCWLSEHDPVDRMSGLVGIVLRPGSACIEIVTKLCNRTPTTKSFLWWENAAVPVNPSYQIFFPHDVTYVNFHYLDSRIQYPIAGDNVFNGIDMTEPRDLSWHKNTTKATSYFACKSKYDFFGGYDHSVKCGVVHIGDHHISPGKKMFTWGYEQLSQVWEAALTDTDGQYAELMAGTYSDNQPNFSWLEPYETKVFTNFWYPIANIGTPDYADRHFALKLTDEAINIQSVFPYQGITLEVKSGKKILFQQKMNFTPGSQKAIPWQKPEGFVSLVLTDEKGQVLSAYQEEKQDTLNMPQVKAPLPFAVEMQSADELYQAGVHVDQYRDPAVMPDAFWKEALKRNPSHVPSLMGMAKYLYTLCRFEEAKIHVEKAILQLNRFNERHESGDANYLHGLILEGLGELGEAYDAYHKGAWNGSTVAKAMGRIACIDLKQMDTKACMKHAFMAIEHSGAHPLAHGALVAACLREGDDAQAEAIGQSFLKKDPLNLLMRALLFDEKLFLESLKSSPSQSLLDVVFDLALMGENKRIVSLLQGFLQVLPTQVSAMVLFTLAFYMDQCAMDFRWVLQKAEKEAIGATFAFRPQEIKVLNFATQKGSVTAKVLLGNLLYDKRHYSEAAALFQQVIQAEPENDTALRNLAVAYFSHLNQKDEALGLMKKACTIHNSQQMIYDTVLLMNKMAISPQEKIDFILDHTDQITYDNIVIELAKAYNQNNQPQEALVLLQGHTFVPFEGGEHHIAAQYMFAHYLLGQKAAAEGEHQQALNYFNSALTLPDSLGAGIWNRCVYYPYYYAMALCYEKLGEQGKAQDYYQEILNTQIDFFSNMHLKELPYYQALSAQKLGLFSRAQNIMTKAKRKWSLEIEKTDNGFYETTPFFISFIDDSKKLRKAQYLYLLALVERFDGNDEKAALMFKEAQLLNRDHLFCWYFSHRGV